MGDILAAILQQPDLTTRTGRRDAVLLSLLYDTGARVQELIELSPRAVRLESPAHVQLTGKGRKRRAADEIGRYVVTNAELLDDAVRAIHAAFELDGEAEATVYGGTGR